MDLQNKTIIVTGAARIGKTVAEDLAAKGANLVIVYFSNKPEIKTSGGIHFVQADLTKPQDVNKIVTEAKNKFGAIHGLVHMAANYEKNTWENLNEEVWNKSMDAIAKSSFLLGKAVGDELLKNDGEIKGKIVLFSDWSVITRPYSDYLPYNVAKAAVQALTLSLAKDLSPGVLANCIAPGPILKPDGLTDDENNEVLTNTLVKRWGSAEEISKAVLYLMDSDFVTGQILHVDGGRSIA